MTCCAPAASMSCARSTRADAAADAARQCRGDLPHDREVVAGAHGGVEIDDLHLRETFEPPHPAEHVIVSDGEPLALHELDDGAVLEIDRGNQHRFDSVIRLTAGPECRGCSQVLLERVDAGFGVVEDRRGQRRVGGRRR